MSRQGKWEYLRAIHARYRQATRAERGPILDEFCQVTGYHRKSALRLLNGPRPGRRPPPRRRAPSYGTRVIQVLAAVWQAAGYPWSVRLKALLPLWLPWAQTCFRLTPVLEQQLLRLSPRPRDRRLAPSRQPVKTGLYGRTKPGTLLEHHTPLRTDRWEVTVPGFTEVDLVAHSGDSDEGGFVHSLNQTDIHTTWLETRAVLGRGETGVQAGSAWSPSSAPSAWCPRPLRPRRAVLRICGSSSTTRMRACSPFVSFATVVMTCLFKVARPS